MKRDFQLQDLIKHPNNQRAYLSYFLKKRNDKIETGEPVCEIRIGNYSSAFRYDLITIKSPTSGYLNYDSSIDKELKYEDVVFSIDSIQNLESDLTDDEKFTHYFQGENLIYFFGGWHKKHNSYVKKNELIYSYSNIRSHRSQYAEKSGRLLIVDPKILPLSQNQLLYTIEYSEFFENENTFDTISSSCFVYLMKDMINGYYKIGISNNPTYREKTLQSEKPTIEMVISKEFPVRIIAESFEKALHKSFENKRIRGEWFSLTDGEAETIIMSLK